jgi:hypothetical protein
MDRIRRADLHGQPTADLVHGNGVFYGKEKGMTFTLEYSTLALKIIATTGRRGVLRRQSSNV